MSPVCPLIQRASGNMWSKRSTSLTWGPRCSSMPMCAPISRQKRRKRALALTLARYGRPECITLDRDTRWVGSPQGSDFPAALLRFGACLGIEIHICDPQQPQQNSFVERYHRTYQEECLALDRPADLEQAQAVTAAFVRHYNVERPHQGFSCSPHDGGS